MTSPKEQQGMAALMARTFFQSTHEERVEHGTWTLIEHAVIAAGYVSPEEAKTREAAARREALLEAAPRCDCAGLLIETNSHEEHCAIYRNPERERDEAVAAIHRVIALAERAKATAVGPNPFVLAADIDAALAEPERDEEGGR